MIPTLTMFTLLCLTPGQSAGLTTDRIDDYAQQVKQQRKDCGPTAVWFVLRHQGIDADREALCQEADIGKDGTSLQKLVELCEAHHLEPTAIQSEAKDVSTLPIPSIIVVDKTHCVVYLGRNDEEQIQFYEPATHRIMTATPEKVQRNWSGEAIVFGSPVISPLHLGVILAVAAASMVLGGILAKLIFRRQMF